MTTGGFDSIAGMGAGLPNAHEVGRMARQQAEALTTLRERLAEVVGTATSEDSMVTVTATDAEVLSLRLDPKAMRKPSEDLSEEIVSTLNAARANFDEQRAQLIAEMGVTAGRPTDLDTAMANMREMGEAMNRGTAEIQDLVKRLQQQAGR